MTQPSIANNTVLPLAIGATWFGSIESTRGFNAITVNISNTESCEILISQFGTSSSVTYQSIHPLTLVSNNIQTINIAVTSPWFNVVVQNLGGSICKLNVATYLQYSIYGS